MIESPSIVNPEKGKKTPDLGSVAILVSSKSDLLYLCKCMNLDTKRFSRFLMSRLYRGTDEYSDISLAGPFIGGPYMAILLETLIAWGVRKVLFFGWCGAVSLDIKTGDIVVPQKAIIDDSVSVHYNGRWPEAEHPENNVSAASEEITEKICTILHKKEFSFHKGLIWSTGAIYRETKEKVEYFQKRDVLAVEMELSTLFSVSEFRNIKAGAILAVSDELGSYIWNPGFGKREFKDSCMKIAKVIHDLCLTI